jgi:glutamate-1-semialdehyde 2,1-aminomutase
MVAGFATLEQVTPDAICYLNKLGEAVRTRLSTIFQRTGFEAQVSGAGSLFRILMTSKPIVNYRSTLLPQERRAIAQDLYLGLLARGVALTNTLLGCISMPMTIREVDALVNAVEDWIREKQKGLL